MSDNLRLRNIGFKHQTDKVGVHQFDGKNFLDIYEMYFSNLRDKPITILELGVLNGASLKVWEEYFTNGSIIGLDIDPSKQKYTTERTKIYTGSQDNSTIINDISNNYPNGFDIVIDDASHINDLTIASFELLFDKVKPGGYYIIEDTHCTYGTDTDPNFCEHSKSWPGMSLNKSDTNFSNNRKTFLDFILPKITDMDLKKGNIYCIHFFSETMVIKKTTHTH